MGESLKAVIYSRISQDRDGEQVGVDRQQAECKAHIEKEEWRLTASYCDNDRSAMKGKRPQFEQMLCDLGHIDVIVVWAADRLYRRLKDLERLVDALGGTRVVALHSGEINLGTADGRAVARILGSLAQRESEKTGERVAAAREERVKAGRNGGGPRPFGFSSDRTQLVESEAEMVVNAYKHIALGGSLHSLTRAWQNAGVRGTRGGKIQPSTVREILLRESNAGLVIHRGQVVASSDLSIIDQDTWRTVAAILGTHKPWQKGPTSLLSGIAVCGLCGGTFRATGKGRYRCGETFDLSIFRDRLDSYVEAEVVARIGSDFHTTLADMSGENVATTTAMDDLRQELQTLQGLKGVLSEAALAAAEASVKERMAAAAAVPQRGRMAAIAALRGEDTAAIWARMPTHAKRQLMRYLMTRVVVQPRPNDPVIEWTEFGQARAA